MRRSLIAITAAAILGATCSAALGTAKVAVNPELVNPVVASAALSSGVIVFILLQRSISAWARKTIEKKSEELVGHVEI